MAGISRGGGSLKLLGSMRGSGVLKVGAESIAVAYHLDRFQGRIGQTASGEVDGELTALVGADQEGPAILVLENGSELAVVLSNLEANGADVEARGAMIEG